MILLDTNNEPTSTVYYLAAASYRALREADGMDSNRLYEEVTGDEVRRGVRYDFFMLALDFLYLLGRIDVDERGGLHVH